MPARHAAWRCASTQGLVYGVLVLIVGLSSVIATHQTGDMGNSTACEVAYGASAGTTSAEHTVHQAAQVQQRPQQPQVVTLGQWAGLSGDMFSSAHHQAAAAASSTTAPVQPAVAAGMPTSHFCVVSEHDVHREQQQQWAGLQRQLLHQQQQQQWALQQALLRQQQQHHHQQQQWTLQTVQPSQWATITAPLPVVVRGGPGTSSATAAVQSNPAQCMLQQMASEQWRSVQQAQLAQQPLQAMVSPVRGVYSVQPASDVTVRYRHVVAAGISTCGG